jgi:nitrite reductase/ring-hydroxylating ferredoxin subunit
MNGHTTNYKALKNRCPHCGHRLDLVSGTRTCGQVSGDLHDPTIETQCPCRNHKR